MSPFDADRRRRGATGARRRGARGIAALLLLSASPGCHRREAPAPPARAEAGGASPGAAATATAAPPPPPPSPESVRRGDEIAARAARCFEDPRCTFEEATRLYLEADDAGATRVSCFRFYYGTGVPADAPRARACFERAVGRERDFAGSSPSLERVFLGLMLLDAQGGPRDRERGRKLFEACYLGNDSGVGAAAEAREKSGAKKPIDFCADLGGTTQNTNECGRISHDAANVDAERGAKEIVAALALDDAGIALWRAADGAWDAFAVADARYVGDAYRGGSMRSFQESAVLAVRARARVEVLRALLAPEPTPKEAGDALKRAEERASAGARDAENRRLLAAADAAWRAYRAAEVAFVRRAFAGRYHGGAAAVRALDGELARRRAAALDEELKASP